MLSSESKMWVTLASIFILVVGVVFYNPPITYTDEQLSQQCLAKHPGALGAKMKDGFCFVQVSRTMWINEHMFDNEKGEG